MKKIILALALTASMPLAFAQRMPLIEQPAELSSGDYSEGTMTQLSRDEVEYFKPWALNAKSQLERALKKIQVLPLRERLDSIENSVRSVVDRSSGKNYQMFMRYALNRGLLLVNLLRQSGGIGGVGGDENALDILTRSISVSLSFYESDLSFQTRASNGQTSVALEYAKFGKAYFTLVYPAVMNTWNAASQYRLLYKLIEMANWDLSKNLGAEELADTIVEADDLLQSIPPVPRGASSEILRAIRRMHGLSIMGLLPSATGGSVISTQTLGAAETTQSPNYLSTNLHYESYYGKVRTLQNRAGSVCIFTDGIKLDCSYVHKLVGSMNGVGVGDKAYESYYGKIRRVEYISSSGAVIFDDGIKLDESYVSKLVKSMKGIRVGDKAYESYYGKIRVVEYISASGQFIFTDGIKLDESYVTVLQ